MGFYRKVDDHYEIRIDQNRMVILGIGAGLLVALLFLVGILMGKTLWGVGPEDVALLREARIRPPPEPDIPEMSDKPKYTFYQDSKRPVEEEPVPPPQALQPPPPDASATVMIGPKRGAEAPAAPAPMPAPAPIAEPEPAPKAAAKAAPADSATPKAAAKAPAPQAAPAKAPAPAEAPSRGAYVVQVASCREKATADDTAKKIAAAGGRPEIVRVTIKNTPWYRVRAVGFSSKAQADKFNAEKLKPKGVGGVVVATP